MIWTDTQLEQHKRAALILDMIKDRAFATIKMYPRLTEWDVQQFILDQFTKEGIVNSVEKPIVAFGPSTSHVHYFCDQETARQLKPESLILIDIWGKLKHPKAPYADITWMGYYGQKPSAEVKKISQLVFDARDRVIIYIKKELKEGRLPVGQEADNASRQFLAKAGYHDDYFPHSTGHSIGPSHVHGLHRGLRRSNNHLLTANLGYTIEPGIYIKDTFGARSEINFYIDGHKLIITTPLQQELIRIAV